MPTCRARDHRVERLDHDVLLPAQAVDAQPEPLLAAADDHRVGVVARRRRCGRTARRGARRARCGRARAACRGRSCARGRAWRSAGSRPRRPRAARRPRRPRPPSARVMIASVSGSCSVNLVPAPGIVSASISAFEPLHAAHHHVEPDAAARDVGDGARGREALGEDELDRLAVAERLAGLQQAALERLAAHRGGVDARRRRRSA